MTRLLMIAAGWWVIAWLIGSGKREAARPLYRRASWIVGSVTLFAAVGALWKWRRHVFSGVAVTVVLVGVCVVVAAWWLRPANRPAIAFVAVAAALFAAGAWDWETTGGRPWRAVCDDAKRVEQVRQAVLATHPDAHPGKVTLGADEVTVEVAHVGPVDAEQVGQVLHAPHVETAPTGVLGRSKVTVYATAPESDWARLGQARPWPGVSSVDRDAPVPIGVDCDGQVVSIPCPGEGGRHVLLAGSTGAGKSVLLSVLLAELAHRPGIRLRLADAKLVELGAWAPVAEVAKGADAAGALIDAVYAEMMSRYEQLEAEGRRQWAGDKDVLVIDELAAVTTGDRKTVGRRVHQLGLILAMGRAAGVGAVLCTQRPSADVVPLDLRDNCRLRIGLGTESRFQTEMIMGDQGRWLCHEIPESMPGVGYVRLDRSGRLMRGFWMSDDDVSAAVKSAAAYRKAGS